MAASMAEGSLRIPLSSSETMRGEQGPPPVVGGAAARWQDILFEGTTRFFAIFVLVLLLGIILALSYAAIPAMQAFGFLLHHQRLEPCNSSVRRARSDLRHARNFWNRAPDRRAGELRL